MLFDSACDCGLISWARRGNVKGVIRLWCQIVDAAFPENVKFVPQSAPQPDTRGISTAAEQSCLTRACKGVSLLLRYKWFVMLHSALRIWTRVLRVLFAFPWPPSVSLPLLCFRSASAKVLLMWNECLSVSLFKRWWPAISTGDALLDASLAQCPDALYHPRCITLYVRSH